MSALPETCPRCSTSFRGPEVPEEYRGYYGSDMTHYSRLIGVEVQGVYDGVLYWQCPDCGWPFHRWTPGSEYYNRAVPWVEEVRSVLVSPVNKS